MPGENNFNDAFVGEIINQLKSMAQTDTNVESVQLHGIRMAAIKAQEACGVEPPAEFQQAFVPAMKRHLSRLS